MRDFTQALKILATHSGSRGAQTYHDWDTPCSACKYHWHFDSAHIRFEEANGVVWMDYVRWSSWGATHVVGVERPQGASLQ